VIYCQSGARSAQACMWLGERDFAQSYNLQGGVVAWLRDGRSLTAPA
jgi:rhodanese-related sulfurtransferase